MPSKRPGRVANRMIEKTQKSKTERVAWLFSCRRPPPKVKESKGENPATRYPMLSDPKKSLLSSIARAFLKLMRLVLRVRWCIAVGMNQYSPAASEGLKRGPRLVLVGDIHQLQDDTVCNCRAALSTDGYFHLETS